MKKVLIGSLAVITALSAYVGANTQMASVPTAGDNAQAILWCGADAGFIGYKDGLAEFDNGPLKRFNGEAIRRNKQAIVGDAIAESWGDAEVEIGLSVASFYLDQIADGTDAAIQQECSGQKGAYLSFSQGFTDSIEGGLDAERDVDSFGYTDAQAAARERLLN